MPRLVLALALLVLAAAGCGGSGDDGSPEGQTPAPPAADAPPLELMMWQLSSGSGPNGKVELVEDRQVTLVFGDGRIGGQSLCNSYGAPVRLDGESFRLTGDIEGTLKGCGPPVDDAEAAYFAALERVDRIRQEGDRLVLTGPETELVFYATRRL